MDLINLWQEKYETGRIRFDEDLLVLQSAAAKSPYQWGTVFYSQARENYKSSIKQTVRKTTFDLDLMSELQIMEFGTLIIAANPNSLFQGHLVIYPKQKSPELNFESIFDITKLAQTYPQETFIHNMERSAASILDWAHYQAYPITFPIELENNILLSEFENVKIFRISNDFPAYGIVAECFETEILTRWLLKLIELLAGEDNPHDKRIPFNLIWRKNRVWVIPRALHQTELAASYFGGLEMGGIFCLPNADDLRRYLPHSLRQEIETCSIAREPETQKWFEENTIQLLCDIL